MAAGFNAATIGGMWFTVLYLVALAWLLGGPRTEQQAHRVWTVFRVWVTGLVGGSVLSTTAALGWNPGVAILLGFVAALVVGRMLPRRGAMSRTLADS